MPIDTRTVFYGTGSGRVVRHLSNRGVSERNVTKVDISAFSGTYSQVDLIEYSVWGFGSVELGWAHTPTDSIAVLQGNGVIDWAAVGGKTDPTGVSTDGTGDVVLTTATEGLIASTLANSAGYDITLWMRMK